MLRIEMRMKTFLKLTKSKIIWTLIILIFWIPPILNELSDGRNMLFVLLGIISFFIYLPVFIIGLLFMSKPGIVGFVTLANGTIYYLTPLAIIWAWSMSHFISKLNNS